MLAWNEERWRFIRYGCFFVHGFSSLRMFCRKPHVCFIIAGCGKNYKWVHYNCESGTEELAHQEMIAAIVYQLTRNLTPEQIKQSGFDAYFVDHTTGIYPQSAAGVPFSASVLQCKGDAITDLVEDLAADAAIV